MIFMIFFFLKKSSNLIHYLATNNNKKDKKKIVCIYISEINVNLSNIKTNLMLLLRSRIYMYNI